MAEFINEGKVRALRDNNVGHAKAMIEGLRALGVLEEGEIAQPQLTEDEAWEIAFRAAKAFRPSYFTGNDFWPHPWVVHAVISATNAGQRAAAKGRDMFSSPRGVDSSQGGEQ